MHFKKGLGEEADKNTLSANVILTIAVSVATVLRNPYLALEIGLCPTVPVIRYDLSNSGSLITRDAKDLPAILTNAGNPYFEMFKDAVENELAQSRKVIWDTSAVAPVEGAEVDQTFLSCISNVPQLNSEVMEAASALLGRGDGHRYAR
jgi:hypothetical protein